MLITFSPLIAGASGRAADAVASNWKGRNYIRKYVIPHNPKTAAQTLVRNSLTSCVTLWRSLSTTIKTWLDTYAVAYRMSGYNTYISKVRAAEQAATAHNIVPPHPHVPAPTAFAAVDATGQIATVTWTDEALAGYTNMALIARNQADDVYTKEILTTLASAETYSMIELVGGATYDIYGWLYNPTSGVMGTVASEMDLSIAA